MKVGRVEVLSLSHPQLGKFQSYIRRGIVVGWRQTIQHLDYSWEMLIAGDKDHLSSKEVIGVKSFLLSSTKSKLELEKLLHSEAKRQSPNLSWQLQFKPAYFGYLEPDYLELCFLQLDTNLFLHIAWQQEKFRIVGYSEG
ncbi:MAG: hypothetical protein HRT74_06690 [Flavobacteriales bacterium]|nr:hypothetical protein [Flavobacteriales bacterium]